MIIELKRFDFVKGTVTTIYREMPDDLPETPLLAMLKRRAAKALEGKK